jgi:chromatin segregation and condensation protein Rec8/ScpA/Scc1 (kleisin family)
VLELIKLSVIVIFQEENFGEISIKAV